MKGLTVMTIALATMLGLSQQACAVPGPNNPPSVRLKGSLNCPYIPSRGGTVYLQVAVETGAIARRDQRQLNIAIVLDRSGSMGAEGKIENAKAALRAVIDQLRSDDILSIVIYDDEIDVLRPAARVGRKEDVRRLVDEITPRGWTNLGGGMVEGYRQVRRYASPTMVNRVLLLSDGLANRGITDPAELARIVQRQREAGISISTVGVGLEYNENLMLALSEHGGGNYYFLESARNLASVLRNEFSMATVVLAQDARVELQLGKHVRVIDVIGCAYRSEGDRVKLDLGDLYGGEHREWTVVLEVPPGEGVLEVVRGYLRYTHPRELTLGERCDNFSNTIRYTEQTAMIEEHRDKELQAKGDIARSTRQVERALKALDEGRRDEAMNELAAARQAIAASPAVAGSGASADMLRAQDEKIDGYAESLKDQDSVKAKKEVQYDNYRTQKRK
jgi:Ca-activated chloride channel family protein